MKTKSFNKWKQTTLKYIMMFEPALIFQEWKGKDKKWDGEQLSAEEALFIWESTGLDPFDSCENQKEFIDLLNRKDNMNFQISEWKQEIRNIKAETDTWLEYVIYSYIVIEPIIYEYGIDFVKRINLKPQ